MFQKNQPKHCFAIGFEKKAIKQNVYFFKFAKKPRKNRRLYSKPENIEYSSQSMITSRPSLSHFKSLCRKLSARDEWTQYQLPRSKIR